MSLTFRTSTAGGGTGLGQVSRGVIVPDGALANFGAALRSHASSLVEVAVWGDSTTYGASNPSYYSWVQRLRARALAAGITDGGYGRVHANDDTFGTYPALAGPDGFPKIVSRTGYIETNSSGLGYSSSVVNDQVTIEGKGTRIRLIYARGVGYGSLSYSIDGGSTVTLDAEQLANNRTARDTVPLIIGPLSDGVHSITVTNLEAAKSEFEVEFLRDAGLVLHRDAGNGATSNSFGTAGVYPSSGIQSVRLGLETPSQYKQRTGSNEIGDVAYGTPTGPRPAYRNVKALIYQIGTNDQNGDTETDSTGIDHARMLENLGLAVRTARAGGADVILVSPPYTAAGQVSSNQLEKYHARYKAAHMQVALAFGCAYVDFQEALGWDIVNWSSRGYGNGIPANPHLPQAAYNAEADFLWDRVISPLL